MVYELTAPAPGEKAWTETVLLSFDGADGATADGAGNLYGTTSLGGGAHGDGVVFELTP